MQPIQSKSNFAQERPYFEDSLGYEERIHNKEEQESFLWDKICDAVPWNIKRASIGEDKKGIDAWIVSLKNGPPTTPKSIQLKMRQYGGDDVILEMVRPWPPKDFKNVWTGRDIQTKVDYYYSVSTKGVLRIFKATILRGAAIRMCGGFMDQYQNNNELKFLKFVDGEAKILTDPSNEATTSMGKVQKLVAFINPNTITPTYSIQL